MSIPILTKELEEMINDENCEDLDGFSGSPNLNGSIKPNQPPTSLNLASGNAGYQSMGRNPPPFPTASAVPSRSSDPSIGFRGVEIEGSSVGDSPTDMVVAATRPGDFISKLKTTATTSATTSATAAMMTVTSPAWSGTSWTGGLSYGCSAALKSTTTTVSLSNPSTPLTPSNPGNKLEYLKNWTISTYKYSRQTLYEKLGKTSRTVDTELESQIETLRDTQRKYANVLRLARALTSHFYHVVQTQSSLGECFNDLAHKSPELQEEFLYNAETQRNLTKNGEQLIGALNFFVSSVNTLCNKTMEDTIATVRHYEISRVEFDAYRADLDFYSTAPQTEANISKQRATEATFEKQKQEFEKLRSDVQIKLKFLDENRVKVMHKQLLLFHNAISAYFTGNQTALEATMKQFSIKVKTPSRPSPSWIEQ